jgi:archaetidylserine synthase
MIKLVSVADIVTLFNATLGFLALLLVFSHQYPLAASFILLGLLADGLDGMIARRLGTGKIGEYLEPLADMISLSIAPLALIYVMYSERILLDPSTHLLLGIVLAFSLICSLIRLSSFSFLKEKRFFIGLPTSASALFLVVLSYLLIDLWYLLAVIVLLSFGMVSSIRFPKLGLMFNLVAAVFIFVTIIFQGRYSNTAPLLLLAALLFYVIVGPIYFQLKHRNFLTEKNGNHS